MYAAKSSPVVYVSHLNDLAKGRSLQIDTSGLPNGLRKLLRLATGEAHLAVRWWVMDDTGRKPLVEHRSEFRRAAPETDEYDALVGAMSALLADLCQETVAELKGLR